MFTTFALFASFHANVTAHGLLHAFHGLFNIQAGVRNVLRRTLIRTAEEWARERGAHQTSTDRKTPSVRPTVLVTVPEEAGLSKFPITVFSQPESESLGG